MCYCLYSLFMVRLFISVIIVAAIIEISAEHIRPVCLSFPDLQICPHCNKDKIYTAVELCDLYEVLIRATVHVAWGRGVNTLSAMDYSHVLHVLFIPVRLHGEQACENLSSFVIGLLDKRWSAPYQK